MGYKISRNLDSIHTMNLLKISGFLLLLNILLVQSFGLKIKFYTNKECSGSPVYTYNRNVDQKNWECVENNEIMHGEWNMFKFTNDACVPPQDLIIFVEKKYTGAQKFAELDAMRAELKWGFDLSNMRAKVTWSGWCDGSLPDWAIAVIVIAVLGLLGLLGVGIYFMFCHKKQKPTRSYLAPTRPQQESPNEYPVAV